jgi:tetratricopeptide (TPR) repeat protein
MAVLDNATELNQQGQYMQAVALLNQLVKEDPQSYDAWLLLSRTHTMAGNYPAALMAADRTLSLQSTEDGWIARAIALSSLRQPGEALMASGNAIQCNPESSAAHAICGMILEEQGRYREALQHLDWSLSKDSDDTDVLAHKAMVLARLQDFHSALSLAEWVVQQHPDEASSWFAKAFVLLIQGAYTPEAEAAIDAALSRAPSDSDAMVLKAAIVDLDPKGRTAEAQALLRQAAHLNPNSRFAHELGAEMERLTRHRGKRRRRYWEIIINLWRMPDDRPTLSSVVTLALGALVALVALIGLAGAAASGTPDPVFGFLVLLLLGAGSVALAIRTGKDTNWFRDWKRSLKRTMGGGERYVVEGHGLARWVGPIGLVGVFVTFLWWLVLTLVLLWLLAVVLKWQSE